MSKNGTTLAPAKPDRSLKEVARIETAENDSLETHGCMTGCDVSAKSIGCFARCGLKLARDKLHKFENSGSRAAPLYWSVARLFAILIRTASHESD